MRSWARAVGAIMILSVPLAAGCGGSAGAPGAAAPVDPASGNLDALAGAGDAGPRADTGGAPVGPGRGADATDKLPESFGGGVPQ